MCSRIGDVTGDGLSDILVGEWLTNTAYVLVGYSGAVHHTLTGGVGVNPRFGSSVAAIDDLDGDAVPDLLVAAVTSAPGGLADAGQVYVFSGASAALLHVFNGLQSGDLFGSSVDGVPDIDGDGIWDIVVGARQGSSQPGYIGVYSGATWNTVHVLSGTMPGDEFGHSIAMAGDVNGDGISDVAIGAPFADPGGRTDAGKALVYAFIPTSGQYQTNCAEAALSLNGLTGTSSVPAIYTVPVSTPVSLGLNSSNGGALWELGYGLAPLVPAIGGGFTTVGGQVINLDLSDPTFGVLWNYFQSPGFVNATIPFSVANPASVSVQMVVVAPNLLDGVAISQPTRLIVQ
jgi:hypothetical protein